MTYRLDSDPIAWSFGRLKNIIFLLYFTVKGIFYLDQKKTVIVKISGHVDLSSGSLCFLACLDGIFQEVGENKTHVDLVYGNMCRQVCSDLERNIFPLCKCRIIAEHAVSRRIFTKMRLWSGILPAALER